MNTAPLASSRTPEAYTQSKAQKAGAQFEAILLNTVLDGLERAFTELPGGRKDHSTEAYGGLAMQGLSLVLANRGGIGLGTQIEQALSKRSAEAHENKVTAGVKAF